MFLICLEKKVNNLIKMTSTFSFEWPNYSWANDVQDYSAKKHHYVGTSHSPTRKLTNKDFKINECFFNPITQKYNNRSIQEKVSSAEKAAFPYKIASYYDRNLRYEQTFDIINLKDKFRVFKNHPLAPREKEQFGNLKLKDMSKIEYNILSNINLRDHHFEKPEKRPQKPSTVPVLKPVVKQAWTFKDYDIISNKYNDDNEAKKKVNEQAFKLESANKYWRTHNFNPVVGKFFDPVKEDKFQEEQKAKAAVWGKDRVLKLPKRVQEQGLLYNPVNQKILDEERLKAYEQKMRDKKKRYERKNQIEEFFLRRDMALTERAHTRNANKKCYEYYRETDNRGYDIISFDKNYNKYKKMLTLKDHTTNWDMLQDKSSEKTSTFGNNNIYKDNYDYSDVDKNIFKFKTERNSKIEN